MAYYSAMVQAIVKKADLIDIYVSQYGGVFVNKDLCASESSILIRLDRRFVPNVVSYLQSLGFLLGDIQTSGIQTRIFLKGFLF